MTLKAKKIIIAASFLTAFALVVTLIITRFEVFGNMLLVMLGFGAVVLVHEFGHFIVAKIGGIKVEAFSIGFPPTLIGLRRVEGGILVRILPDLLPADGDDGDCELKFTIPMGVKEGETEYRIGMIPFGGFVKMLGQEDTSTVEATDDPRSYVNKGVGTRMAVIVAGVTFNIISALIVFMTVFLVGIKQIAPVVGGVMPGSPADVAGLRAGDEVISVDGKSDYLEFNDIVTAAALSGKGRKVKLKVRHVDESIEKFEIEPEKMELEGLGKVPLLGVFPAESLVVANVEDVNSFQRETGLLGGDVITAVNGKPVKNLLEYSQALQASYASQFRLSAKRIGDSDVEQEVDTALRASMSVAEVYVADENDLNHVYSMVPRLKVTGVAITKVGWRKRLLSKLGIYKGEIEPKKVVDLNAGDIVIDINGVGNPTYYEFRKQTQASADQEIGITVLRAAANGDMERITVRSTPEKGADGRVVVGINIALDGEHPVVAKCIEGVAASDIVDIPRGATITAVDGEAVKSFFDVVGKLKASSGERVSVDWRLSEAKAGGIALATEDFDAGVNMTILPAVEIPFEPLKRLYKADDAWQAVEMGVIKTGGFVKQAYISLLRLLGKEVSPKSMMGPLGIIGLTYKVAAEKPFIELAYFLGLLSAFIAVFNLLPLLPFDGGHIVFLAVEKIKGSPVSQRIQAFATYVGLAAVGALFLYVTLNDIMRIFGG
jgi:regulator of sigma E protease